MRRDRGRFQLQNEANSYVVEGMHEYAEEQHRASQMLEHVARFEFARANHAEDLLGADGPDEFLRDSKSLQVLILIL